MSGDVRIVQTPNPDAFMFRVNETLVPNGTYEYFKGDNLDDSPLAQRLLPIQDVELILIAPRFITVRKDPTADWEDLFKPILTQISEFIDSGEMAVIENESTQTASDKNWTELEQQIVKLLDEDVRPAIAQDGGDLVFHGFEDGMVKLELIGACGTCPSSTATLHFGIQNLLMEEFDEVEGVEQITSNQG